MRRKMITVSAALALMLSVAGCSDKAPMETTPAASVTTTEAVNVTAEETTAAPATTLAEETPVATVTTTVADTTLAETTTAPVTTAEETEAIEPDIPLNAEYFPDEGFRQFVSQYDRDLDGYLSPEERVAVTKIQCPTGYSPSDDVTSIHSLAGIQYFSELEVLFCSDLDLAELDVSHNRKLAELYCNNNKLTALDLSNNNALSQLECYNNQLTSLDLRANQKLQGLNCVANSLSAITLPKHSRLKSVKCFCNPSLEINANNCSSPDDMNYVIIFFIDATASISNQRDDGRTIFRLEKRYDHAPLEDGYYYAELIEKDEIDDHTEDYYSSGYEYSFFTGATADQDTLTIQDARLFTSGLGYSYSYDCGTISLPLAQTVTYEYDNHTYNDEASFDIANDFNTFYSAMIKEYQNCFSEDTSGDLYLAIHIFNGSIDVISISVYQYP